MTYGPNGIAILDIGGEAMDPAMLGCSEGNDKASYIRMAAERFGNNKIALDKAIAEAEHTLATVAMENREYESLACQAVGMKAYRNERWPQPAKQPMHA